MSEYERILANISEYERILVNWAASGAQGANGAIWEVHEGSKEAKKEGPRRPDID